MSALKHLAKPVTFLGNFLLWPGSSSAGSAGPELEAAAGHSAPSSKEKLLPGDLIAGAIFVGSLALIAGLGLQSPSAGVRVGTVGAQEQRRSLDGLEKPQPKPVIDLNGR